MKQCALNIESRSASWESDGIGMRVEFWVGPADGAPMLWQWERANGSRHWPLPPQRPSTSGSDLRLHAGISTHVLVSFQVLSQTCGARAACVPCLVRLTGDFTICSQFRFSVLESRIRDWLLCDKHMILEAQAKPRPC